MNEEEKQMREEAKLIEESVGFENTITNALETYIYASNGYSEEKDFFEPAFLCNIQRVEDAYAKGNLETAQRIIHDRIFNWERFSAGKTHKGRGLRTEYGKFLISVYEKMDEYITWQKDFLRDFGLS